jgi:septal ring factor EnvC (AmiA/AmiB activator)
LVAYLDEQSEWLYEEGANKDFNVYRQLEKNLTSQYERLKGLKVKHQERDKTLNVVRAEIADYKKKLDNLEVEKPWITEDEKKNVTAQIAKIETEL